MEICWFSSFSVRFPRFFATFPSPVTSRQLPVTTPFHWRWTRWPRCTAKIACPWFGRKMECHWRDSWGGRGPLCCTFFSSIVLIRFWWFCLCYCGRNLFYCPWLCWFLRILCGRKCRQLWHCRPVVWQGAASSIRQLKSILRLVFCMWLVVYLSFIGGEWRFKNVQESWTAWFVARSFVRLIAWLLDSSIDHLSVGLIAWLFDRLIYC